MAEAIVDGTSSMRRFFCHRCSVEIEHLLPDFTCPRCSTGFIEELERNNEDAAGQMDMDNQDYGDIDVDVTGFDDDSEYDILPIIRAAAEASARSGANYRDGWRRSHRLSSAGDQTSTRNTSSRNQQHQQAGIDIASRVPLDSLIQEIFFNLSGIGFGFAQGQGGQAPVLFLGNPGDYVWGQQGLDSIVTQLLNQMDGTGPPPLPRRQIDEIPTTSVSQIQVDLKLQCSVCWEDFILEEPVRQLPCQHFYHAPCIVPWLELHGTCPICRQSLGDTTTIEANQDTVSPSLAALFRAANESNSSRTSSTSLGSSSRNDSPNEM
ncbi:E3 ubiquitin-protein ligase Iruka isoform X2 [Phymastichus coffea]|uniref:E3 ubiquitin-protein ligase Iruka isoform X2 n=1 Tax=Phymastichus coffea TaxID=108790 RepID=UPI00273AC88E|nr:E3 ubiquitin-protein ligase Iruka isoform X2 [Phymastichus coffea]